MKIKYLKREEIEDKKWNGCVHFAINNMPYAYTWYLDNVAEFWDGLVYGDYEIVFPLVYNNKWGVEYLYQPFFTQQLGIFSHEPFGNRHILAFLEAIPQRFKYIDIQVNAHNKTDMEGFEWTERTNLELDLSSNYKTVRANYSSNTKRNLKKTGQHGLSISNNIKPEQLVDFFKQHTAPKIDGIQESHFHTLHRIIYKALHHSMGGTFGVYNANNQLIATTFYLYGKSRIINLLPSTSDEGRDTGAAAFLLDTTIRQNAGKPMILDFEGSMIPSIARFYKGFGAEEKPYWQLKRNNLPWYMKLFKQ